MNTQTAAVQAVKKGKFQKIRVNLRNHWQLYILLVLPIIYTFTFKYRPMYGILIAFKQFNMKLGITASPWIPGINGSATSSALRSCRVFWATRSA